MERKNRELIAAFFISVLVLGCIDPDANLDGNCWSGQTHEENPLCVAKDVGPPMGETDFADAADVENPEDDIPTDTDEEVAEVLVLDADDAPDNAQEDSDDGADADGEGTEIGDEIPDVPPEVDEEPPDVPLSGDDGSTSTPDPGEVPDVEPDIPPISDTDDAETDDSVACTPDCTDKQCGDDGCGGMCGSCEGLKKCQAGVCVDLCDFVDCMDTDPCTDDFCAGGVCTNEPGTGVACDDDDFCTSGDQCEAGACEGVQDIAKCQCQSDEDCVVLEDGNLCNGIPACDQDSKTCVTDLASIIVCPENVEFCKVTACNPQNGACETNDRADTTPCDDSFACTEGDSCAGGTCAGALVLCQDENLCTDDACNPETGGTCVYTPNAAPCEDGNPCTIGDACLDTACASGSPKDCDDKNPCTTQQCNGVTGDCAYGEIKPCCTSSAQCGDDNPCTLDICDMDGFCLNPPHPKPPACEDGNLCTIGDSCVNGECVAGSAPDCNDQTLCTTDTCNMETGSCVYENNQASCSDDDACTVDDVCSKGTCQSGTPKKCEDGNVCNGSESCEAGLCEGNGNVLVCTDGNVCTDDACDPKTGCMSTPNTQSCDDGNVCTGDPLTKEDTCTNGACVGKPNPGTTPTVSEKVLTENFNDDQLETWFVPNTGWTLAACKSVCTGNTLGITLKPKGSVSTITVSNPTSQTLLLMFGGKAHFNFNVTTDTPSILRVKQEGEVLFSRDLWEFHGVSDPAQVKLAPGDAIIEVTYGTGVATGGHDFQLVTTVTWLCPSP